MPKQTRYKTKKEGVYYITSGKDKIFYIYYRKDGKPIHGFLFGLFLVLVFGVRIVIEFIKEPQVGFERNMLFNMGQLLSLPFVVAGLFFIGRAVGKKSG